MKKILLLGFIVLSFSTYASSGKEGASIGVVISTLNNPFFVDLVSGIEAEAKNLKTKVIVLDSQNDSAKELANVEDLISKGVKAILINPNDSDAAARSAKIAKDAGIIVVSLDRSINGFEVDSHVASDNVSGGKMAGEFILKELGSTAKIVELEGIAGSSAARERGEGFNSVASKNVVARQVANFDRTEGLSVLENIIQSNVKFNAVFAHNDEMALGALKALQSAKLNDVLVVGFDATDDARDAVKNGLMRATVAQQPKEIGSKGLSIVGMILAGKAVDKSYSVDLKLIK